MEALIALFAVAEALVQNELLKATAPSSRGDRTKRLAEIRAILTELRAKAVGTETNPGAAWEVVRAAYVGSASRTAGDLKQAGEDSVEVGLGAPHLEAARIIYERLTGELDSAISGTGRRANEVVRKLALRELFVGKVAGRPMAATTTALERSLRDDGIESFTDSAGRRWKLSVYARNKATQAAGDAAAEGTVNRLQENGFDLVKVSHHATSCDICKQYEGRIFSISGESDKYSLLERRPAFHPHCRHVLVAHVEALSVL